MKRRGIKFRRADHLTWRYGDPGRDRDGNGLPIQAHFMAIVRRSQCERDESGYITRETINKAPCLPGLIHNLTNMAYGPWRRHPAGGYCCPVYWVEDGNVYRGSVRRAVV